MVLYIVTYELKDISIETMSALDPDTVLLTDPNVDDAWKTCVLQGVYFGENEYNGGLGARISSIFVIFFVSTGFTVFPLLARTIKKLKLPLYFYIFARYFGSGVILATAFIHLMDPAYLEIGGHSCVGSTGYWSVFPWCPTIIMTSVFVIFLIDVLSDVYVERQYGESTHVNNKEIMDAVVRVEEIVEPIQNNYYESSDDSSIYKARSFRSQIAAFLVLEFGIIFHSVMIGLNLGAVGEEFKTLYIVLIFHQSFEGLGLGARLSAIPWPNDISYVWAYLMCFAYGIVTPVSIAIGLGVRTTYLSVSYKANIVTGVLDSISAGILIYSGLVELLARDFLFDREAKKDLRQLAFMLFSVICGATIMGLLGKWA